MHLIAPKRPAGGSALAEAVAGVCSMNAALLPPDPRGRRVVDTMCNSALVTLQRLRHACRCPQANMRRWLSCCCVMAPTRLVKTPRDVHPWTWP